MDWRHPNLGCLFQGQHLSQEKRSRSSTERYTRSVKNPPLYGICIRDYDRDHRPRQWPSGTEYQYAYCSNYRALLPSLYQKPRVQVISSAKSTNDAGQQEFPSPHKLRTTTPLPIIDLHYRGALYHCNDPLGVTTLEELSHRKEDVNGLCTNSARDHMERVYTPNYRYKDWASSEPLEIYREIDANSLFCQLPEPQSKYLDFYNNVRMNRPILYSYKAFRPCNFIPIPMNKDIPNIPS